MKIGFIGLGNMGAPMAANLAKAGHEVTGFDVAGIVAEGCASAASAPEAAAGRDAVITMLPNGEILTRVAAEIVPAMTPGAVFVDCSTVDVDSARAAHESASRAGLLSVDAPVSGGVGGAAAGSLTFMAGGSDESFAAAAPLFEIMGAKAVHCGAPGAGQAPTRPRTPIRHSRRPAPSHAPPKPGGNATWKGACSLSGRLRHSRHSPGRRGHSAGRKPGFSRIVRPKRGENDPG